MITGAHVIVYSANATADRDASKQRKTTARKKTARRR